MKILFVLTELNVKFGMYGFQHGIAALSAYLKSHGYLNIRLFYQSSQFSLKPFLQLISAYKPDIIGFYTTHDQYRFIQKLINEISDSSIFTICGGPHATLNPEIIYETSRLNAICIGEGEIPMLELIKTLENKTLPRHIKNLWIRDRETIIKNTTLAFFENIEKLPFADRELFSQHNLPQTIGLTQICYKNSIRISRGCPYQCAFCSNKQIGLAQPGHFLRFRSVDNVIAEIKSLIKNFSPREFYFEDDTFTLNEPFIDEFCEKYPKQIGIAFEFFSHISFSTIRILKKLRKAGGRRVSFGIESGNEQLRKKILKKNFSNKQIINIFKAAKKLGYHTEAFVMAGLPDETIQSFNDTVKLLKILQPDLYSLSIYFPFQGTDLYKYSVQSGYIQHQLKVPDNFVSRRDTLLQMPQFSRKEILNCVKIFGWQICKNYSLKKALLFRIYESRLGDILLKYAARYKRLLRRLILR